MVFGSLLCNSSSTKIFHCVMVLSSIIGSAAISSLEWNNIEQRTQERTHQGRTCFLDGQRSTTKWGLHDHTQNWVNGDIWVFSLHILTFRRCRSPYSVKMNKLRKVEIFLEQREVAFLSPSKICENLNFSTEIQIFANFAGW